MFPLKGILGGLFVFLLIFSFVPPVSFVHAQTSANLTGIWNLADYYDPSNPKTVGTNVMYLQQTGNDVVAYTVPLNSYVHCGGTDRSWYFTGSIFYTGQNTNPIIIKGLASVCHYWITGGESSPDDHFDDEPFSLTFTADCSFADGYYQTHDGPLHYFAIKFTNLSILCADNQPPVANAGPDQIGIKEGSQIFLDGSGSRDPDNDSIISYKWWVAYAERPISLFATEGPYPWFYAPSVNKDQTRFTIGLQVFDGKAWSSPDYVDIFVKPYYQIKMIRTFPEEINPYPRGISAGYYAYPPGNNPPRPSSALEIIVTHLADGSAALAGITVTIEACPQSALARHPGDEWDGHGHDERWQNPCQRGDRPFANFQEGNISGNPIKLKTENDGILVLDYQPPKFVDYRGFSFYISGEDVVTARLEDYPGSNSRLQKSLITRVPSLQAMPGSEDCPIVTQPIIYGDARNYRFEMQNFHDCSFFGTEQTNLSINRIANAYMQRQMDCMRISEEFCLVPTQANSYDRQKHWDPDPSLWRPMTSIKRPEDLRPIRVTAMSLQWGGLLDIGPRGCLQDYDGPGPNPDEPCRFWQYPHKTHNNGKVVDIGISELDADHKLLLRYIISQDPNFDQIENCEGRYNILAAAGRCTGPATHIHATFVN